MSQPIFGAVKWTQEWHRFSLTATNQTVVLYLNGCANLARARSPTCALAELNKTQIDLLRHSIEWMPEHQARTKFDGALATHFEVRMLLEGTKLHGPNGRFAETPERLRQGRRLDVPQRPFMRE